MNKKTEICTKIRQLLLENAEENYQKFSASLLPGTTDILGVRLPLLRKIAKNIYKENPKEFLNTKPKFFEEILLQGMIIGLLKEEPQNIFKYMETFIPQINNWSVCDTFCCSLKFTKQNKKEVWNFIQPYMLSQQEFEIRFALVMMLNYFIDDEYLNQIFEFLKDFSSNAYYAQMAAGWLISICFIKYPNETMLFLKENKIDKIIYNKAIQKIIESRQVDKETKDLLRKMKI